MTSLLTKSMGVAATSMFSIVGIIGSSNQAQAISFATLNDFTNGTDIVSGTYTARGISFSANPDQGIFGNWTASIQNTNTLVSFNLNGPPTSTSIVGPKQLTLDYVLSTTSSGFSSAGFSLDISGDNFGTGTQVQIFSDAGFTNLLATAAPGETNDLFTNVNSIWVRNTIIVPDGPTLNSATNIYGTPTAVPLETDAFSLVFSGLFIGGGVWLKRKRNQAKVSELVVNNG